MKIPNKRRQYVSVTGWDNGLDYSMPTTLVGDNYATDCRNMLFSEEVAEKGYGTTVFADTDTTPLSSEVTALSVYTKSTETERLIGHTLKDVYTYNPSLDVFENITQGIVLSSCETAWTASANVTATTSTTRRKGDYSASIAISASFTTGIAAYINIASADASAQTTLHFFIRSSITLTAGQLRLRLSDAVGGGTGGVYADYNIPAIAANTWTEVNISLLTPDASSGGSYPNDLTAILSIALVGIVDVGATTILIDDIMATVQSTATSDEVLSFALMNDYYLFSDGVAPIRYWDMAASNVQILPGCASLLCNAMTTIGGRVCLYSLPNAPRRVKWTIAGGISIPPSATDWTASGAGDADLDDVFGNDIIMTAHKLGSYAVLYGKENIVLQEYVSDVDDPFSFYIRVPGVGTPSKRGVANIGSYHIFLGWSDIYKYMGDTEVVSIGDKIRSRLFSIINMSYIHRSFLVYIQERDELRVYVPIDNATSPNAYFTYDTRNERWTRAEATLTGFGKWVKNSSDTWHTYMGGTVTWSEAVGRWNDQLWSKNAPSILYGDSSGIVYEDLKNTYDMAGVAVDAYICTKDYTASAAYRRETICWMELTFEACGHNVSVYYSTDLGVTWTLISTVALTSVWTRYSLDIEVYSPQICFKFRNNTLSETFRVRQVEPGFVGSTDREID